MSKTQTTKPSCLSEPTGRVEVSILVTETAVWWWWWWWWGGGGGG